VVHGKVQIVVILNKQKATKIKNTKHKKKGNKERAMLNLKITITSSNSKSFETLFDS
jgi:hypothetical protein